MHFKTAISYKIPKRRYDTLNLIGLIDHILDRYTWTMWYENGFIKHCSVKSTTVEESMPFWSRKYFQKAETSFSFLFIIIGTFFSKEKKKCDVLHLLNETAVKYCSFDFQSFNAGLPWDTSVLFDLLSVSLNCIPSLAQYLHSFNL